MALQTPRSGLQRPSIGTASSPSLRASATAASRKASYQALTGQKSTNNNNNSTTPVRMDAESLEVGDTVNVPGDMYGVVKYVGGVRGKNGHFVGVELDREFAARGKNDGDVDGYAIVHAGSGWGARPLMCDTGFPTLAPLYPAQASFCLYTALRSEIHLRYP